jgi:hypothetical protein
MYSFYAFPLDLIFFIMWMVAFGLLANLTAGATCTSNWYWNYWGYYWGRFWVVPGRLPSPGLVGRSGCAQWRTTLAFSFIGGCFWGISAIIGLYVITSRHSDNTHNYQNSTSVEPEKRHWWNKKTPAPSATQTTTTV